jgi:hypothetical protein
MPVIHSKINHSWVKDQNFVKIAVEHALNLEPSVFKKLLSS